MEYLGGNLFVYQEVTGHSRLPRKRVRTERIFSARLATGWLEPMDMAYSTWQTPEVPFT